MIHRAIVEQYLRATGWVLRRIDGALWWQDADSGASVPATALRALDRGDLTGVLGERSWTHIGMCHAAESLLEDKRLLEFVHQPDLAEDHNHTSDFALTRAEKTRCVCDALRVRARRILRDAGVCPDAWESARPLYGEEAQVLLDLQRGLISAGVPHDAPERVEIERRIAEAIGGPPTLTGADRAALPQFFKAGAP